MPDKLTELFDTFKLTNPDATDFQLFQAGLSAGALSMRTRAMKVVQNAAAEVKNNKVLNDMINGIGKLSDIPD